MELEHDSNFRAHIELRDNPDKTTNGALKRRKTDRDLFNNRKDRFEGAPRFISRSYVSGFNALHIA